MGITPSAEAVQRSGTAEDRLRLVIDSFRHVSVFAAVRRDAFRWNGIAEVRSARIMFGVGALHLAGRYGRNLGGKQSTDRFRPGVFLLPLGAQCL